MDITKYLFIFACIITILVLAMIAFRRILYIWILLAGAIGIPVFTMRDSRLMLGEALLAPLLLLWLIDKSLHLGWIGLSEQSMSKTSIEKSLAAMVGAFTISGLTNIIFPDTSVSGEHTFVLGKLMALFIYVGSVMVALLVADVISSPVDARTISILLIALGIFSLIGHLPLKPLESLPRFFAAVQRDVGWPWMSVATLFSFSLGSLLFHPRPRRNIRNLVLSAFLAILAFLPYFLRAATYKAGIVANATLVLTAVYYRSKRLLAFTFLIGLIVVLATLPLLSYYVQQEEEEGSWGAQASSRTSIWSHSLRMFLHKPIVGIGPYNYWDVSLYVAEQTRDSFPEENWGVMTTPHGQYVQILTETGIVGTAAFLWFLIELFRLLKSFVHNHLDHKLRTITSALASILVSRLVASAFGDYIIPQYHNGGLENFCSTVYFWVCLGVLIGIRKLLNFESIHDQASVIDH